jgi:hypothetical protein
MKRPVAGSAGGSLSIELSRPHDGTYPCVKAKDRAVSLIQVTSKDSIVGMPNMIRDHRSSATRP